MQVLILSISKRSGHHHAANALETALHAHYPAVDVINQNYFDFIKNPMMERMINRTYLGILKTTPEIWDYVYDNDKVAVRISGLRNFATRQTATKFNEILQELKPSAIVCTQAFPCEIACILKRNNELKIPIVAVVTDFVAHSYWIHPEVDLYAVPSEATKQEMIEHHLDPSRIEVLGIPIKPEFEKQYSAEEKLQLKIKMGFDPELPIVLLMGGSQGFGPMENIIQQIAHHNGKIQLIVIAGLNSKLRRNLLRVQPFLSIPMHVYGYVNNIQDFMTISDILITKPGGITTSEALIKELPMIIIHPLPGQEENNSVFLNKVGAVIRVDDEVDIAKAIHELLSVPGKMEQLRANMVHLAVRNSGKIISDAIIELVDNYQAKKTNNQDAVINQKN